MNDENIGTIVKVGDEKSFNDDIKSTLNKNINYFSLNVENANALQCYCQTYHNRIINITSLSSVKTDDLIETCKTLCNIFNSILKKHTFYEYRPHLDTAYYVLRNVDFSSKEPENASFADFYEKLMRAEIPDKETIRKSNYIVNGLIENQRKIIFISKGKPFVKSNGLLYEIDYEDTDNFIINKNGIKKVKTDLLKISTSLCAVIIDNDIVILGDSGRIFFQLDKRADIISQNNLKALESNLNLLDKESAEFLTERIEKNDMIKSFSSIDTNILRNARLNKRQKQYLVDKGVIIKNDKPVLNTDADLDFFIGIFINDVYRDELNDEDVIARKKRTIKR